MNTIWRAPCQRLMYRELFFFGGNLVCLVLALFMLNAVLVPGDVKDDSGRISLPHSAVVEPSSPTRFESEHLLVPVLRLLDRPPEEVLGDLRAEQRITKDVSLFASCRGLLDSRVQLMHGRRDQTGSEAVTLRVKAVGIERSLALQRPYPGFSHDLQTDPFILSAELLQIGVQLHEKGPIKFATLKYHDGATVNDEVMCISSKRRYHEATEQPSLGVLVADDRSRDSGDGGELLTSMSADADNEAEPDPDPDAVLDRAPASDLSLAQTLVATNVATLSMVIHNTFIPPRWSTS